MTTVETKDTFMRYVDSGRGDPVVLLRGNPTSSYVWRNIMPYVSDIRRCLVPIDGTPRDVVETVEVYGRWLQQTPIPKLLSSADPGSMLVGRGLAFARTWPNQREVRVRGIHFVQDDSPHEIGTALREFLIAN